MKLTRHLSFALLNLSLVFEVTIRAKQVWSVPAEVVRLISVDIESKAARGGYAQAGRNLCSDGQRSAIWFRNFDIRPANSLSRAGRDAAYAFRIRIPSGPEKLRRQGAHRASP
jgi:hypothetical protein